MLSYKSISRPLWSFEIEKLSKKTSLVFYSLNSFGHKFKDGYTAEDLSALYFKFIIDICLGQSHINMLSNTFLNKENELIKFGPIIMSTGHSFVKSNEKYLCILIFLHFEDHLMRLPNLR